MTSTTRITATVPPTGLWSGGYCDGTPVVVYGGITNVEAYTLPGLNPNYVAPKPARSMLRPDFRRSAQRTPD